jgi:dienelactone hydrolase
LAPRKRLATVGFCFGGAIVWLLLTAERRLAAAAPSTGRFRKAAFCSAPTPPEAYRRLLAWLDRSDDDSDD